VVNGTDLTYDALLLAAAYDVSAFGSSAQISIADLTDLYFGFTVTTGELLARARTYNGTGYNFGPLADTFAMIGFNLRLAAGIRISDDERIKRFNALSDDKQGAFILGVGASTVELALAAGAPKGTDAIKQILRRVKFVTNYTITNGSIRKLTSTSGNYTPSHAVDMGDVFDARLPARLTGQPTNGVIDIAGVEVYLKSGAQGPANRWYKPAEPAINQAATHVEGHAAALMVKNGITDMSVTINNRTGPCNVCKGQIPDFLPQGSTLNVRWQDAAGITHITPIPGRAATGQ
jgi:hypothetical protein